MIEKLYAIKDRFKEVSDLIVQPDIISNMSQYIKLSREYKELEMIVTNEGTLGFSPKILSLSELFDSNVYRGSFYSYGFF